MPENTASSSPKPRLYKHAVCPFCSLLCDDIQIENRNQQLTVQGVDCKKSRAGFEQTLAGQNCQINGKTASLDEALDAAAGILKKSSRPLISGLGTDVDGVRASLLLAETVRAYFDHMGSAAAMRNYRVLQDKGYIMTSLAEVKNRSDLIILAGTDAVSHGYPRFFQRFVWNPHSMFDLDTSQRQIVYIGDKLNTRPGISPDGDKPLHIKCPKQQIGEVFGILNALLAGQQFATKRLAGVPMKQLEQLLERIRSADYGTVVWSTSGLDFPHAELTVQSICDFISQRNRDSRFAGLSLTGNDGGMTAANVCAWQSGYPLRIRYSNGFAEYDPYAFATDRLLARKEVDSIMWISAFGASTPSPKTRLPSIVLADSRSVIGKRPDVFIPVGTPGLDHGGQMTRTDSVVSMTLSAVRNSGLPSVHEVLTQLQQLIQ